MLAINRPMLLGDAASDVMALQQALKDLSVAANYPSGDPGPVDGIVGGATVTAIAQWVGKLPSLPIFVRTILSLVGMGYSYAPENIKKQARDTITQYAGPITSAVNTLLATYLATATPPAPPPAAAQQPMTYTASRIALPQGVVSRTNPGAARFKSGSIARFNKTRGTWSVYSPLSGSAFFGVSSGGHCVAGNCLGEVTPPVPSGFVKVSDEVTPPADVTNAGEEEDDKPWYKRPLVWAIGGLAVAGGVGVAVARRR